MPIKTRIRNELNNLVNNFPEELPCPFCGFILDKNEDNLEPFLEFIFKDIGEEKESDYESLTLGCPSCSIGPFDYQSAKLREDKKKEKHIIRN